MMNSRTKNAKLNVLYGYIAQIGVLLLSFVGRKVFLMFLSADYLGVNGLYSNILTILSLPELGVDTALVFSLFKPIADNDNVLVASLLKYFKKIYLVLAISLGAIGMCLVPFLPMMIDSNLPTWDLIGYYLLILANTIASYFVAYKATLLSACQEQRIRKLVALSSNLLLQVLHIVVLWIWKNYYVYLLTAVCTTVFSSIILGVICNRRHRDIFATKETVAFDVKPIKQRIFSVFFYKMGTVLINSTDNILISVLVSTVAVGYYSNYQTVILAINCFIGIISSSLIAGIGNLAAQKAKTEQGALFDMMVYAFHALAAVALVGFSLLFNHLITVWLGAQYLFDDWTVFIIAFNFYVSTATAPVWMFREANGLFDKVKYLILIRAALNIVSSIAFGLLWGVFGVILATVFSLVVTSFWIEPRILSKEVLGRRVWAYWRKQLLYFAETAAAFGLSYWVIMRLGDSIGMLALKIVIVTAITGGIFVLCNLKTPEFKKLRRYVMGK